MSNAWAKGSTTRWRTFRASILARDRYLCTIKGPGCTTYAPLRGGHVDHYPIPLSRGGAKFDPANARAACRACNLAQGDRMPIPQPQPRSTSNW